MFLPPIIILLGRKFRVVSIHSPIVSVVICQPENIVVGLVWVSNTAASGVFPQQQLVFVETAATSEEVRRGERDA